MCDTCGCDHHHSARLITIEQNILEKNEEAANRNRQYFQEHHIFTLNLMSSPGSGKTSLLVKTIEELNETQSMVVIEGDQQTDLDAQRIAACHLPVLQINTGKGCHLNAESVFESVHHLPLQDHDILFIENVGNLVCPASFDLGENLRVVILSVTEGDDKPLKYPYMFHTSHAMLINKIDLLPYVSFDMKKCIESAHRLNPDMKIFELSAQTGEGLGEWCQWLVNQIG
jgi:hydrogenase nickel incorporation protein HypB